MDKINIKTILILSILLFLTSSIVMSQSIEKESQENWKTTLIAVGPSLFLLGIFIIVFFVIYLILRNMKTTKKDLELSQKSMDLHEETNKLLKEIAEALKKK